MVRDDAGGDEADANGDSGLASTYPLPDASDGATTAADATLADQNALDASALVDGSLSDANGAGSDSADADAATPVLEGGASVDAADAACQATELLCDGACVPDDPHHCGGCDHDCTSLPRVDGPVACLTSGACSFALASCAPGWTHCAANPDLGCETDLSTSSNCGACANACSGGTPLCSGTAGAYACSSGCPASTPTLCGESCVDTTTSATHCGTCANACSTTISHAEPVCVGSACTIACNTGYSSCSGACVDEQTDPSHCGSCSTACTGSTSVCLRGACVACMPAATQCSGAIPQTCDANGAWQSGVVTAGQCGAICTPSTTQCSAVASFQTCGPTGQWGAAVACTQPTPSCSGGACVCPAGDTVTSGVCCPIGQSACGGVCVNEQTDNANCGACGLTCGTGCSAGRCLVTLASGAIGAPIAVDSTNVYWVQSPLSTGTNFPMPGINKIPAAGGMPTALVSAPPANSPPPPEILALALDTTSLYWALDSTDIAAGSLQKLPVVGGATTTLASTSAMYGIALNASSVYVTASGPGGQGVLTLPVGGGTPSGFASVCATGGITLDGTNVYCTTSGTAGAIDSMPLSGGALTVLASSQNSPNPSIAVNATNVYWLNRGTQANNFTDGAVMTVALAGGPTTALASGQTLGTSARLAIDASSVYWTTGVNPGTVMKVPLGGGSATTLASGQAQASGIAVDATSVYWATVNGNGGTLMKLTPK